MAHNFEEIFNRQKFEQFLNSKAFRDIRMGYENAIEETSDGELYLKKAEPETSKKKEFVLNIDNLYRMPIGHSGDIPRKCITCQDPPTQFATVYSAKLTLTYHFCNDCFIKYHQKEVPKDHDGPTARHLTGDNTSKPVASGRQGLYSDYGPIKRPAHDGRESIPIGPSEASSGDSGSQQEDGGVETAGFLSGCEVISEVAELLLSSISES